MTDKPNCNHCWHDTGMILTSYPPQTQERCCYCGEYRNRRVGVFDTDVTHGAYVPKMVGFFNEPVVK
jgi:hypothetical protein